jgi:hypothetical protein
MVGVAHLLERVTVYGDVVDILLELMAVREVLKGKPLSLSQLHGETKRIFSVVRLAGVVGGRVEVICQRSCSSSDDVEEMQRRLVNVGAEVKKVESELNAYERFEEMLSFDRNGNGRVVYRM